MMLLTLLFNKDFSEVISTLEKLKRNFQLYLKAVECEGCFEFEKDHFDFSRSVFEILFLNKSQSTVQNGMQRCIEILGCL